MTLNQPQPKPGLTLYPHPNNKPHYKRSTHFRKQSGPQRYEDEDKEK